MSYLIHRCGVCTSCLATSSQNSDQDCESMGDKCDMLPAQVVSVCPCISCVSLSITCVLPAFLGKIIPGSGAAQRTLHQHIAFIITCNSNYVSTVVTGWTRAILQVAVDPRSGLSPQCHLRQQEKQAYNALMKDCAQKKTHKAEDPRKPHASVTVWESFLNLQCNPTLCTWFPAT